MGSDNKFNDTIRLISNAIKTNPLDLLQEDDVADEQRRTQEKESALAQANARLIDEKARKAKDKSDLEQIAANYESAKITKEELIHEVGLLLKEAKKDGDGYIENIKSLAHSNVPIKKIIDLASEDSWIKALLEKKEPSVTAAKKETAEELAAAKAEEEKKEKEGQLAAAMPAAESIISIVHLIAKKTINKSAIARQIVKTVPAEKYSEIIQHAGSFLDGLQEMENNEALTGKWANAAYLEQRSLSTILSWLTAPFRNYKLAAKLFIATNGENITPENRHVLLAVKNELDAITYIPGIDPGMLHKMREAFFETVKDNEKLETEKQAKAFLSLLPSANVRDAFKEFAEYGGEVEQLEDGSKKINKFLERVPVDYHTVGLEGDGHLWQLTFGALSEEENELEKDSIDGKLSKTADEWKKYFDDPTEAFVYFKTQLSPETAAAASRLGIIENAKNINVGLLQKHSSKVEESLNEDDSKKKLDTLKELLRHNLPLNLGNVKYNPTQPRTALTYPFSSVGNGVPYTSPEKDSVMRTIINSADSEGIKLSVGQKVGMVFLWQYLRMEGGSGQQLVPLQVQRSNKLKGTKELERFDIKASGHPASMLGVKLAKKKGTFLTSDKSEMNIKDVVDRLFADKKFAVRTMVHEVKNELVRLALELKDSLDAAAKIFNITGTPEKQVASFIELFFAGSDNPKESAKAYMEDIKSMGPVKPFPRAAIKDMETSRKFNRINLPTTKADAEEQMKQMAKEEEEAKKSSYNTATYRQQLEEGGHHMQGPELVNWMDAFSDPQVALYYINAGIEPDDAKILHIVLSYFMNEKIQDKFLEYKQNIDTLASTVKNAAIKLLDNFKKVGGQLPAPANLSDKSLQEILNSDNITDKIAALVGIAENEIKNQGGIVRLESDAVKAKIEEPMETYLTNALEYMNISKEMADKPVATGKEHDERQAKKDVYVDNMNSALEDLKAVKRYLTDSRNKLNKLPAYSAAIHRILSSAPETSISEDWVQEVFRGAHHILIVESIFTVVESLRGKIRNLIVSGLETESNSKALQALEHIIGKWTSSQTPNYGQIIKAFSRKESTGFSHLSDIIKLDPGFERFISKIEHNDHVLKIHSGMTAHGYPDFVLNSDLETFGERVIQETYTPIIHSLYGQETQNYMKKVTSALHEVSMAANVKHLAEYVTSLSDKLSGTINQVAAEVENVKRGHVPDKELSETTIKAFVNNIIEGLVSAGALHT